MSKQAVQEPTAVVCWLNRFGIACHLKILPRKVAENYLVEDGDIEFWLVPANAPRA